MIYQLNPTFQTSATQPRHQQSIKKVKDQLTKQKY